MRLESVSKIYTATLILQLGQEGKLRVTDTVARWLPGLLPYGKRITIRQLLTMSSGLIDNNDFTNASDSGKRAYLFRVRDAGLRKRLLATAALVNRNPAAVVPPMLWVRWAAWQPLLFPPGTLSHYSNIGYDILGLIAARAGGKALPTLYRERIFKPLGLRATAYDPQGPISGPHANGYGIAPNGTQIDTTDWHWGVGAEGGIVSDAKDTATFLAALMHGSSSTGVTSRRWKATISGAAASRAAVPGKPTAGAAAAAATRPRSGSTTAAAASPCSSSTPVTGTQPSPQRTWPHTTRSDASTAQPDADSERRCVEPASPEAFPKPR
jgi:D-alanyl-D-alanine carboxypeptidase